MSDQESLNNCDCYCSCGVCFLREYGEMCDDFEILVEREDSRFGPLCNWGAFRTNPDSGEQESLVDGFELTMKGAIAAAKKAGQAAIDAEGGLSPPAR